MTVKTKTIVLLVFVLTAIIRSDAQSISATSCSQSAVSAALNSITADNTTVIVPAGSCTWTSGVNFTSSHTFTLQGQSSVASTNAQGNPATFNDSTVIVDGQSGSGGNPPIVTLTLNGASSQVVRLTGFTFQGGNVVYNGVLSVGGTAGQLRLDHNHFINKGDLEIAQYEPTTGVADHNLFDVPAGSVFNNIRVYNSGGDGYGDAPWAAAPGFGSSAEFYFENNTFNNGFMNDCELGGVYVARFNTFNVTGANENIGIQSHALGSQQRGRGCRAWEVYGNVIGGGGGSITYSAEFQTAGTGIIWGNNVSNTSHDIAFNSDRENTGTYPESTPPNGWGYCGSAQTGSTSPWDGDTNSTGYPCMDNIGRGQGDMLSGYWPKVQNNTQPGVYTGVWPHEISQPVYVAAETCNCSSTMVNVTSAQGDIKADRDFYQPVASFNGTSGTGSGSLAARPSTCTAGVGYWATDQGSWNKSSGGQQGQLFVCSSANTWSLYYTPYSYPHPLISGSTGPGTPTALQGVVVN